MKKILIIGSILVATVTSRATIVNWDAVTDAGFGGLAVADGNMVGAFNTYTLTTDGTLNSVNVYYSLTGGRAGDLIGYLILNNGGTTYSRQLINRLGVTLSDPFGDGANSSTLSVSAPGTSVTTSFGGGTLTLAANSTWTLYLADLATGGGTAQLSNWGLSFDVTPVPEPATWALLIFGGVAGGTLLARRLRRATV